MKKLLYQKGFTLIEMICVISIIGILTTIAIPKFNKYIDKANETKITSAVLELNNNLLLLKSLDYSDDITVEKLILEVGDKNLGLKIVGDSFSIGKYKGKFLIKENKVVAQTNEPFSATYSLNGKNVS